MIRPLLVTAILLFSLSSLLAQIKAVTNKGDKVILFNDGTWEYEDKKIVEWDKIPLNKEKFEKDKKQDFLIESTRAKVGIWLDATKWAFEKSSEEESEYSFQLKEEDLYAMMISEKVEIPLENLKDIVLQNAKAVAPNAKITKQEFRVVNGQKILQLKMEGTTSGMNFVYLGYYLSDESGTVQLITYTSSNLFDTYENDMERFLNGLVSL